VVKDKHMTAQGRFTRVTDTHIHSGLDDTHQFHQNNHTFAQSDWQVKECSLI
jgi:hypothetical protein